MQSDKPADFSLIVHLIKDAQARAVHTVNAELINLYWSVGGYINTQLANATWGNKTVDQLADFIQKEQPQIKGFNRRGLYRMKQFYETYSSMSFVTVPWAQAQSVENNDNAIVSSVMTQLGITDIRDTILTKLSWTHHLVLITRAKTDEEREFYLRLSIREGYTVKELERQIDSGIYQRTMLGNAGLPSTLKASHPNILDAFRNDYVLDFLGLPEPHNESDLQKGLIAKMKNFILELGKDFIFMSDEYRVQVGNSDFYIDLLFYHRGLQCLVAFELKATKFLPEHLGQLNFYLEALDRDVKKPNENPSIGVLLCKDKDSEVVEYALSRYLSPTMVSEYKTQLPDKKILQRKLHELFDK